MVVTVATAAAQSTSIGKEIHRLAIFDGHLYPAYGDYGGNTGPIDLVSVDLTTQTLGGSQLSAHTEEIFRMRVLDAALHVPYVDPQGTNADPSQGQLAIRSTAGTWTVVTSCEGVTHAFDVAKTSDGLFLLGANESEGAATIWRSTDDGATWAESVNVADPATIGGNGPRFYAVAQIGDDLTAFLRNGTANVPYHWNGTDWDALDPVAGPVYGIPATFTHNGTPFALGLPNAVQDGFSGTGTPFVIVTPGDSAQRATIQASLPVVDVFDAYSTADALYLLCADFTIRRGDTTGTWTDLMTLDDTTVRCLAVDESGGYLYFGTTDSRILRTPIPA